MIDADKLRATVQREIESLRTFREEVRLQVSLAKADVRSEWARLETRFALAQEECARLQSHSKATLFEIATNLRTVIEDLKHGYAAVRSRQQN